MARGFPSHLLRYVANCEVDWVGLLAAENRKLSFVGRDNEWHNSATRDITIQLVLKKCKRQEIANGNRGIPVFATTIFRYASHDMHGSYGLDLYSGAPGNI